MTIYTIGHSTRPIDEFIQLLKENGVGVVVDVRTVPGSRRNPQYNRESLQRSLHEAGVEYLHVKELGGFRKPAKDSPNTGWKKPGFRGYADYMLTENFESALSELLRAIDDKRTALMCAEAVPWRCHRSLIADALTVKGLTVEHIIGEGKVQVHELTSFARIELGRIVYDGVD